MLNGREKVGDAVAEHFGPQQLIQMAKVRRVCIPFGKKTPNHDVRATEHEHNLREIPLANGALGCALWDGGVVLTRWIYENGAVFHNKRVLELGCGVGLGGIMAAHWAKEVILTDYIPEVIENALYNAKLNHDDDEPEDADDASLPVVAGAPYRWSISSRVKATMLDWDRVAAEMESGEAQQVPCCTRIEDPSFHVQKWFHCSTCWPDDASRGCCAPCAAVCHQGHEGLTVQPTERFKCDPHACRAIPTLETPPIDIIVGSELTYNLISCSSLAAVVDKYLSAEGVFYEVLSNDRDGVGEFIKQIEARGFTTAKNPAPEHLIGNYPTRRWSKQEIETYSLYTWRRKTATTGVTLFPDMR